MTHKDAQQILDSLVVFCPLHGWAGQVFGKPADEYDGPDTPWHKVTRGEATSCNGVPYGPHCGRELVLGTFDAVGECTLDEITPALPPAPVKLCETCGKPSRGNGTYMGLPQCADCAEQERLLNESEAAEYRRLGI